MINSHNSSRRVSFVESEKKKGSISESNAGEVVLGQKRKFFEESETKNKWFDADDDKIEVDLQAQAKLRKIMRRNGKNVVKGTEYQTMMKDYYYEKQKNFEFFKWAKSSQEENPILQDTQKSQNISNLLKTNQTDLYSTKNLLPEGILGIRKVTETLYKDKLNCVVQTMNFNNDNPNILLAGGYDKNQKFFEVSFDERSHEHELNLKDSIYFENFPIKKAEFLYQGKKEVAVCGVKKSLVFYDLEKKKETKLPNIFFHKNFAKNQSALDNFSISPSQEFMAIYTVKNNGYLGILNPRTKQLSFELKMNETCQDISFAEDSNYLFTVGETGNIYQWDLRKRAIVNKVSDQASLKTTAIGSSKGFLTTGTSTGQVNLYNFNGSSLTTNPVKVFDHLDTTISSLKMDMNNELLFFASKWKKNALRVANISNKKVYKNWPNFKTNLGFVNELCVNKNSDFLAVANEIGMIKVYSLNEQLMGGHEKDQNESVKEMSQTGQERSRTGSFNFPGGRKFSGAYEKDGSRKGSFVGGGNGSRKGSGANNLASKPSKKVKK